MPSTWLARLRAGDRVKFIGALSSKRDFKTVDVTDHGCTLGRASASRRAEDRNAARFRELTGYVAYGHARAVLRGDDRPR
jgi:hypothetical protein